MPHSKQRSGLPFLRPSVYLIPTFPSSNITTITISRLIALLSGRKILYQVRKQLYEKNLLPKLLDGIKLDLG